MDGHPWHCSRRDLAALAPIAALACLWPAPPARAGDEAGRFIAEAFAQRDLAVAAGDQPYGAVVVQDGVIIGLGPSRVVRDRNADAHAERVAIAEARRATGRTDLGGALLYSSSRPCRLCERAAAGAGIARMIFGAAASDAGAPRG